MNLRLLLRLALICAVAMIGKTHAATRIALVGTGNGVENLLDTATSLLSKGTDLQLLDRAEVGRVLREQEISLAGLVRAEHAVKAGQLLHADLFAVLEGALTNETNVSPAFGLVVFNARNGVRYADSALGASNAVAAASATAVAIRAAVAKAHRNPKDMNTVGVLRVHNADLPRQFDSLCDSVGLLLERELTASPGIAVLERRRLEQINKERGLPTDTEVTRLLSSLRMIELDISQDGPGLRGTLGLVRSGGTRTNGITASVPTRNPATLAQLLAHKIERFLKAPVTGISADDQAEAARFYREYLLLIQHGQGIGALHALDAALALDPEEEVWQRDLVQLLPGAAMEVLDPDGQYWARGLLNQPSSGELAKCLGLGLRGADLLVDLSRQAVARTESGQPIAPVLWWNSAYRAPLCQLFQRLADVKAPDPSSAAEMVALVGKERILRTEVMEPYLSKRTFDMNGLINYSTELCAWLGSGYELYRSDVLSEQRRRDDVLALSHWVQASHKINPPDSSGEYRPVQFSLGPSQWNRVDEFRQTLEQDQDPVIRVYARANRVAASLKDDGSPSNRLAAVHEFLLYAQDVLAQSAAPNPSPFRNHVWEATRTTLILLLNHDQGWKEFLESSRFAIAQGEVQPGMFLSALGVLDAFGVPERKRLRKVPEELEVVNGALKLVREKPAAYPATGFFLDRSGFIKDLEQRRDRLTAELAGITTNTNLPMPAPWKRSVCLLDLAKPINGLAWLFKPVVQDGQVFALALGFHEWGLPEDSVQLVSVPLEGGPPSFLGRAKISGIDWRNRPYVLDRGPASRLADKMAWIDVGRAACVGAGYYFAGTGSGAFIFPTNGGPVLHLGITNGLPSEDIRAVAFLDGKLYIGADGERAGYLAAYDPATHKLSILGSSRRSEHLSPFDDQPPFCTLGLVADPLRHRLLMSVSSAIIATTVLPDTTTCMGIWDYRPSTGEYKRLAPLCLCNLPRWLMHRQYWAGLVNANTLATKEMRSLTLFDVTNDHLFSVYDAVAAQTTPPHSPWREPDPTRGYPRDVIPFDGPFLLRDGWLYSARPFARMAMADGRREELALPRTDYPFEIKECLQLLEDGKHILAADQYRIWLLEL